MGIFRKLFGGDGADDLVGTAQVVAASSYNGDGVFQSCRLNLVIQVEGLAPYSAEHTRLCSHRKWPYPGMVLPVRVRAGNPQSFELDFDAVPDDDEVARRLAEQQAAMLRGQMPAGGPLGMAGMAGANIQFVGGSPADLPPEKRARLEQFLGVDLDGDGIVGANPAATTPGPGAADPGERIEQLERLARLHADGALTDDEFAAEKRRLLGT